MFEKVDKKGTFSKIQSSKLGGDMMIKKQLYIIWSIIPFVITYLFRLMSNLIPLDVMLFGGVLMRMMIFPVYWVLISYKYAKSIKSLAIKAVYVYSLITIFVVVFQIPLQYIICPEKLLKIDEMTIFFTKFVVKVQYVVLTICWCIAFIVKIIKNKNCV